MKLPYNPGKPNPEPADDIERKPARMVDTGSELGLVVGLFLTAILLVLLVYLNDGRNLLHFDGG